MGKILWLLAVTFALVAPTLAGNEDARNPQQNNRGGFRGGGTAPAGIDKEDERRALMKIGKAVDRIAADVEEFGTVSMSSPLLTLPTSSLWFKLEIPSEDYYKHARTEVAGRALSAVAISHALGVDLQGAADLDQMALARAVARQMQPDQDRYQALVASRQKQADNVYEAGMAKARAAGTKEERLRLENQALKERDQILQTDLSAYKPSISAANSSPGPQLPGSGAAPVQVNVATTSGTTPPGSESKPDKPAGDKPAGDKPAGDKPAGDKPAGDKPAGDKPAGDKPAGDKPAGDKPAGDKPAGDKPAGDKPATSTPAPAASGTGGQQVVNVGTSPNGAPRASQDVINAAAIDAGLTALGTKGSLKDKDGNQLFGGEITLPDLDAVKAAEAAKSLEGLANFFHYPVDAMQFRDKIVMMGAITVSVVPGWRTRKDWAGEVVMVNKYIWKTARREVVERMTHDHNLPEPLRRQLARDYNLPWTESKEDSKQTLFAPESYGHVGSSQNLGEPNYTPLRGRLWIPPHLIYNETTANDQGQPLVSGISPLMQSDSLDLASAFKRQDEFALALATTLQATGWKAQAKVFDQFVKNQKKEVQTRSTSATVATYSRAGGVVGFQIGPRLKALEDPSNRSNKSGFVLERQAFPALLVYGLDSADIYPRIHDDGKVLTVYEVKIQNTQRTYWQPLTYRYQGPKDWFNPFKAIWPPVWWEAALKRDKVLGRVLDLNDSLYDAHGMLASYREGDSREKAIYQWAKETQEAGMELTARYAGAWNDQYIPAEVQVPLGRVKLPAVPKPVVAEAPPPPAPPPQVDTVQPSFQTVKIPKAEQGKPAPVPPIIELAFVGDRLQEIQTIQCRYGKETVEFLPEDGSKEGLLTKIRPNVILMQVRVAKSVGLQFEFVPKVRPGIAAGTVIRTPVVNVVVNGEPVIAALEVVTPTLAVSEPGVSQPAIRPSPPELPPARNEVNVRPVEPVRESRLPQEVDLRLWPEPLPRTEPKISRR